MSESQARRLVAMLTERQRLDMLMIAAILQAENGPQQEETAKK